MDMDVKLLGEARKRRDSVRKQMLRARAEAEALADEYHRLDDAVTTLESSRTEHEDFARDALGT